MLCALLLALGALALINRTVYDPAGQVRQYFQALREGDGSRALGILDAQVPQGAAPTGQGEAKKPAPDAALMDGQALKNSVADLKDLDVRTTSISEDGEHASVTADYELAGQRQSTEFHLHRAGSHWGVFDRWHIDRGSLPTVQVSSPTATTATVNNVKVGLTHGTGQFVTFYPGVYKSTYVSSLYEAPEQQVAVTAADQRDQKLSLQLEPSSSAQNAITYQIASQLDSCATQDTLYPAGCPFEYPFTGRVQGDVSWAITEYPKPKPAVGPEGNWLLPESRGKAKISFTELDLLTGQTRQVTEEVPFTYRASVSTGNEQVKVTPQQ